MLRYVLEKCRTVVHTDKSKGTSSAGPFFPSMALGSELYWEGPLLAETMNKVQRLLEQRTILSGLYSGPGLLSLARPKHRGPGFIMGTSLLPALVAPQQIEKGGSPSQHLLKRGRWRGKCVGCLYLPLRRHPAGGKRASSSKIGFPHILPPQNVLPLWQEETEH